MSVPTITKADSTSASAFSTGTGLTTERDVYYGTPKINNSKNYNSNTTIYAPTSGGSAGQVLISKGSTSTPEWADPAVEAVYYPYSVQGNGDGYGIKMRSPRGINLYLEFDSDGNREGVYYDHFDENDNNRYRGQFITSENYGNFAAIKEIAYKTAYRHNDNTSEISEKVYDFPSLDTNSSMSYFLFLIAYDQWVLNSRRLFVGLYTLVALSTGVGYEIRELFAEKSSLYDTYIANFSINISMTNRIPSLIMKAKNKKADSMNTYTVYVYRFFK